jgi:hypothetical protein
MARQWTFVLVVAFLFVMGAVAAADRAEATCSGDDCGCYIDRDQCVAECPGEGEPGYLDCVRGCNRDSIRCAKCCCCQCYICSPNWGCGGGLSAKGVAPADESALSLADLVPLVGQCSAAASGQQLEGGPCTAAPPEEPVAATEAPAASAARD